jgi:hypothetical protein
MVYFRAALGSVQSVRSAAPGARHGHQTPPRGTANGSGTAHASGFAETCSPCAAQVGWKLVISDLACAVCRACGAPPPVHAMDTGSSQGLMPMVLAGRAPRGPPSLPPEPRGRHPQNTGVFLEVHGYPWGAKQSPLLVTTVPGTLGSGMGATCGGRRRPGEREHQRSKPRGGRQNGSEKWVLRPGHRDPAAPPPGWRRCTSPPRGSVPASVAGQKAQGGPAPRPAPTFCHFLRIRIRNLYLHPSVHFFRLTRKSTVRMMSAKFHNTC